MPTTAALADDEVPRGPGFWLRPGWWVRALAFWWLPALLGLFIAIVGAARLVRGGVALSWRGMERRGD